MVNAQLHGVLRHLHSLRDTQALAEAPDAQLLEGFARGHEEASFATLVRRHGPMVWSVSRRVLPLAQDAEDVFQATFLLLARKAASIRKAESVGSWLHGVAHRLALKVRLQQTRRQAREKRAADMRQTKPSDESSLSDVQAVLDAALAELPEKYRAALVLCYLEGKTHEEAARHLDCPLTTLRTRVARGRKLLRDRLVRRGLTLSAAGLAALLIASAAPAAAPAALVKAAVRAALPFAAGQSAATLCSEQAAGLVERGLRTMFLTKMKTATVLVLAVSLFMGATAMMQRESATAQAAPPPAAGPKPLAAPERDDKGKTIEVRGRVVDPEGKPFSGAKVYLVEHYHLPEKPQHVETSSGADGAFRLSTTARTEPGAEDNPFETTALMATAAGYGPAIYEHNPLEPTGDLTLRLVRDDVPIHGRILDLQGKPLAGVTVRVLSLATPAAGDLSPWLEALQANPQDGYPIQAQFLQDVSFHDSATPFSPKVTDAEGRFELTGVGRERVVEVVLEGPTIARTSVSIRTRPGKTIVATMFARNPEGGKITYHGATFDHAAAPTRPIIGTVRDKDTGKPLAGVTIQSDKFAGSNTSGDSSIHTVTDKDGRYQLVGMTKGVGNVIKAAPALGQPYFQSIHEVEDSPGLEPVTVDFTLKRGVLVKGRVLDKATGRPVYANVTYVVFTDNLAHKAAPGFTTEHYLQTKEDGSFELVAFPGRGLLTARGWSDHYRMGVGADQIKGKDERGFFLTEPYLQELNTFHRYVEINPAEGSESIPCDLLLDPGRLLRGTVVGPDGKPLAGAQALGLTAYSRSRNWTHSPLQGADFMVYGLGDGEGREVLFLHTEKKLAGALRLGGDDRGPLTVKLEPWGVVTGRVVSAEGKAQAGALLRITDWLLPGSGYQTDRDGRFRIEGLAPDKEYTLDVVQKGQPAANVFTGLKLKAGETRDLGDVAMTPKK
jgi:RNA polymerase sigma factor (sigma-70 family)